MLYKRQPKDKTVVLDFKVLIADLVKRNVVLQESVAKAIQEGTFVTRDVTLTETDNSIDLGAVTSAVIVHAYTDVKIVTLQPDAPLQETVASTFIVFGAYERVQIYRNTEDVRVTCISA